MEMETTKHRQRIPVWARWLAVFVWMGIIFYFSDQPNSTEVTRMYFGGFNYWVRKLAHISEYAILFLLCRSACIKSSLNTGDLNPPPMRLSRQSAIALAITIGYACTDEWHQSYVFGRTGIAFDVLIDSLGPLVVLVALLGAKLASARVR